MADSLEYPDVLQETRGAMNPGRLKLQVGNIIFKNVKTGKLDQFSAADIQKTNWLQRARGQCLKVTLRNGTIHRYDGFKESDFDKLSGFIKNNYSLDLEKIDMSLKGWNWGSAVFRANALDFEVGDNLAFEVPLNHVSNALTAKNEVTIEFHNNDDAAVCLTELRFHIPSDNTGESDPVAEFHANVMAKADVIQVSGDAVCIFQEVQCLTPRGRYDIKIYNTFLQLHGKTFDYKIPFNSILRLFLLPHRDQRQMFFVVSLDPPIKHGQTRYHFFILLFMKEHDMTVELDISEDELQTKYEGKLSKEISGPEYEVVSRIMKAVCNRKITVPGAFVGNSGAQSIACSFKAATGFLYPLERGFIFVHKPPVHIRFDEVSNVNFARSAGSTRSFDFDVETKAGAVYTFVGIEKDEYSKLYDFVRQKKLRVKNIGSKLGGGEQVSYEEELLSSGEEAGNHDAYLERMKAEGKERDDDDDYMLPEDTDSSDESFAPPESGSEVAEEYDTNPSSLSSSSSSTDDDSSQPKKSKKKEKKRTITIPEPGMKSSKPKKEKRMKKQKGKKDPNAPKRPQGAYFLWLNDNREKLKEENPGISITEISKKAGERWKEIGAEEKAIYEAKSSKEKEKYEVAIAEYKQSLIDNPPDDDDEDSTKGKKSKKTSPKNVSPSKAGSGAGFKSKEYISSSGSGSDSDSDEKPLRKKEKPPTKKKKVPTATLR